MTNYMINDEFVETKDNVVIGYYQRYIIVKDETDALFFAECEGRNLPVGISLFNTFLRPVTELNAVEQEEILKEFE